MCKKVINNLIKESKICKNKYKIYILIMKITLKLYK
jgi:hypothetical protein